MLRKVTRLALAGVAPLALVAVGPAAQPASAAGLEYFGSSSDCNNFRTSMISQGYRMGTCQNAGIDNVFQTQVWNVWVGEKQKTMG